MMAHSVSVVVDPLFLMFCLVQRMVTCSVSESSR